MYVSRKPLFFVQHATIEKIYKHSSLNELRTVFRQLVLLLYTSKDAPRPLFSNARRFISFRQLLMPLRAHLWTVALRKIRKILEYESFFEKNIQNLVTLIMCKELSINLCYICNAQKMREDPFFLTHYH